MPSSTNKSRCGPHRKRTSLEYIEGRCLLRHHRSMYLWAVQTIRDWTQQSVCLSLGNRAPTLPRQCFRRRRDASLSDIPAHLRKLAHFWFDSSSRFTTQASWAQMSVTLHVRGPCSASRPDWPPKRGGSTLCEEKSREGARCGTRKGGKSSNNDCAWDMTMLRPTQNKACWSLFRFLSHTRKNVRVCKMRSVRCGVYTTGPLQKNRCCL